MPRLLESETVVVEWVSDASIYNGDLWAQLCLRLGLLSRDHVRTLMGLYTPRQFQTALQLCEQAEIGFSDKLRCDPMLRYTAFNYSEAQNPPEQALSDIDGLCAFGTWNYRFFKNFVIGEDGGRVYSYHTEFRLTPAGELLSGVTLNIFKDALAREKRKSGFIGFIAGDHPLGSLSVIRTAVG